MYGYAYIRAYIRCIGQNSLYIRQIPGVHEMRIWPNPGFWLNCADMKIAQALTLAHAAPARQASHRIIEWHCTENEVVVGFDSTISHCSPKTTLIFGLRHIYVTFLACIRCICVLYLRILMAFYNFNHPLYIWLYSIHGRIYAVFIRITLDFSCI